MSSEATIDGRMEPFLLDFLAYLELERGLSRNTLEAYRCDLQQLGAFLERRGVSVTAAQHGDLAAFIAELTAGGAEGAVTLTFERRQSRLEGAEALGPR